MRTKRLLGAAAAATIAAIAPLSATIAAAAEPTGVGTGTVSSTLLSVNVGDGLLSVRVLGDDGTSTIDPAKGTAMGSTSLTPLTISSTAVPALNVTSPSVSSSSTGAEDKQSVSPELPAVPAFSGSLTANLSSIVDAVGARSGLDATLSNLAVAGGLLNVPSATVDLGTNAATTQATGTRGVSIPSIEVLNLGAVLEGLGLPLAGLPLDDLLALLDTLGATLDGIADPAAALAELNTAIDTAQAMVGDTLANVCSAVDGVLDTVGGLTGAGAVNDAADTIIDTIGGQAPTLPLSAAALADVCTTAGATVQDLIDDLQDTIGSLISSLLATLDDTALLSVEGIDIGLVAGAKSTVETSVANVTGTIGSVKVGSLALPALSGLDLTAAADILSAAGDTVSAAVGDVLSVLNAELANMIDVDVLKIEEIVAPDGDYATATARVTALAATITPPAILTGALDLGDTAGDALDEVGTAVPALAPVMGQLEAAFGGLDLLTSASSITVGQLTSTAAFHAVAAGTPTGGELPRTGTNAAVPAMAAVLVAGVALGIRRFVAALSR